MRIVFAVFGVIWGMLALAGCTPSQLDAAAKVNCALAADGSTVVAIIKPGYAAPANAAAVVGCDAGQAVGAALGSVK
jgi:hypothetical protein